MKSSFALIAAAVWAVSAAPTLADYVPIQTKSDFVSAVHGKQLTRSLVKLSVSPSGTISGTGAVWDVTGTWTWEGSYFCRTLFWGGKDLGYNCQTVARDGAKIRFTSDKGAGESAIFSLR